MKKRILFILLSLALSLCLSLTLASCDEPKPDVEDGTDDPTLYTVTFDSDGGTSVAAQTVEEGKKATEPEAPAKDGYVFLGWYLGDNEWSFIGYVVTEDITLKAKWETEVTEPDTNTVTFDSDGGTPVAAQTVENGKKATEPEAPTKDGYVFLGWYLGDNEWAFIGYVVTEDMTLKAKWEAIDYVLSVQDALNGNYTLSFTVESETFTVETPLGSATKRFIGWRVDESEALISKVTVNKGSFGDLEIIAVYKDICLYHVDADGDGVCDVCVEDMDSEGCEHDDVNGDEYCDICGTNMPGPEFPAPLWESQTIIMQLNRCSNKAELSSELQRYVAGETGYNDSIDKSVAKRNIAATNETKVSVTYKYWDDIEDNEWGHTINHIDDLVNSTTIRNAPDIYSTFIYDLVGASVKGYFANLKGTSRGSGKLKGLNYFEFVYDKNNYDIGYEQGEDRGFMYDWMESVTLDPQNRMYVLASDYYIDFIRAMLMIPVNKHILEEIANEYEYITGDRNEDGVIDLEDFYAQVKAGEWTYELMMDYAAKAYIEDDSDITTGKWLGDKRIGFAMSDGRVATAGIVYAAPVNIIEWEWNPSANCYDYYYPTNMDAFFNGFGKLADAVEALLDTDGVVLVKREYCSGKTWNDVSMFDDQNEHQAIRAAFGQSTVLFGDIIMVGALEENEYQKMTEGSFGVLPIPIYHDNLDEEGNAIDKYVTQVHSVGRAGAIAYNSKKFVECTAFLNYQSTHSAKILNDYFTYNLCYSIAGGGPETVEMLKYLRDNARNSFDMAMEDAMCVFDKNAEEFKMTNLLNGENDFMVQNIEENYEYVVGLKQGFLDDLVAYFKNAKD